MSVLTTLLMLPQWLALALVLAGVVLPALMAFFVVHRSIPVRVRQVHNDVAGFVFAAVGVIYGVLMSFIVIVVWEQWHQTEQNVQEETAVAVSLFNSLGAFPDEHAATEIRALVPAYLREVVRDEFPSMAAVESDRRPSVALGDLWQGIQALEPDSARDQVLFEAIVLEFARLHRLRDTRLADAVQTLPDVIWLALLVGAGLTIGFVLFLGTENVQAHALMVALLAALIGVVLYVAVELDLPFSGTTSIGPERFLAIAGEMGK